MKILGLITEYNPFHNGHYYHMHTAKKLTSADYTVVIMSGNFVQRGSPSLFHKYLKTQMALHCGADLVLELPVCYATSSAEDFARGSISILNQLSSIDYLCFGSECGEIKEITAIAEQLSKETSEFKVLLKEYLASGLSYPLARANAYQSLHPSPLNASLILNSPNNILGVEYVKAIKQFKSPIIPLTIKRHGADYHSSSMETKFASASAIRANILSDQPLASIEAAVPPAVFSLIEQAVKKTFPIVEDDLTTLLFHQLLYETEGSLSKYLDVSDQLSNRIMKQRYSPASFLEFAKEIKSKQYTLSRIHRALLHIILNITTEGMAELRGREYPSYARILGFKKSSSPLLKYIKQRTAIPLLHSVSDSKALLNEVQKKMLMQDLNASHLYNHLIYHKYKTIVKNEYTHGIYIH